MGGRGASGVARMVVSVVGVVVAAAAVLSPAAAGGLGKEAAALVAIRAALHDPGQVLRDWDPKSGDPCRWSMVTCHGGHVQKLSMMKQNLSGTLSPAIGRLRSLRYLCLRHNAISGPIPETIGRMKLLQVLDLSNNQFSGSIPSTLGNMVNLHYLKLNNNSLSGPVPDSLVTARRIFNLYFQLPIILLSLLHVQPGRAVSLGHLKQYRFKEIRNATNNFSQRNILGEGGYGIVYKGHLPDGTPVAVKRLKDHDSVVGDDQFHTEVEVISLAVHRNLLHLIGFCIANNERLLVYPYMPNGTVASKLKECVNGEPALDWPRRKMIALGASRGLLYLHEQCDPKIIHRDIKASNILLDEYLEAIVADFGLAKLVDHGMSHVVTTVRGTVGRIPPEYFMSGHTSEKTDVFCFGLLLIELVTGRETLELHQNEYQKGGIIEWAKELLEQNQLSSFADKKLRNNYDSAELEEMVQIALLCTRYNPKHRPRMFEVVTMLEGGDGVAEKWEAMKNVEDPDPDEFVYRAINSYYEDQSNSIELEAIELSGPR
ncbi:Protein NSP-INTERACTING KINASE 3 [Dichanthelium oligosanthes]|uniref:non-specific serine/threonine protein kinase n=1 Tax=Dichanthelium oligosanthes TaxID=888268 RepID=A0A1E5VN51_9POAL|nr:Protein NSP-INTERACTING KINASE 3 [Dichanthelium oligosanthes]